MIQRGQERATPGLADEDTISLFEALALIAYGDHTRPIELLPPAPDALNSQQRDWDWVEGRAANRWDIEEAARRLSKGIWSGAVPAKGHRMLGGVSFSSHLEYNNPIPVLTTELQNCRCKVIFDQLDMTYHPGGRVIFESGISESGIPNWIGYCDVHVSREALVGIAALEARPQEFSEKDNIEFLIEFAKGILAEKGRGAKRAELKHALDVRCPPKVTEDYFRKMNKLVPKCLKHGRGAPKNQPVPAPPP